MPRPLHHTLWPTRQAAAARILAATRARTVSIPISPSPPSAARGRLRSTGLLPALFSDRCYRGLERVALAAKVAFALVLDHRGMAAPDHRRRIYKFDVRRTVPQPIDPQTREGDQVVVRATHGQDGVPELLDDDRARAKGRLLRVVSDKLEPLGLVLDGIGSDRGVVRDLLDEEGRAAAPVLVGPVRVEEPAGR